MAHGELIEAQGEFYTEIGEKAELRQITANAILAARQNGTYILAGGNEVVSSAFRGEAMAFLPHDTYLDMIQRVPNGAIFIEGLDYGILECAQTDEEGVIWVFKWLPVVEGGEFKLDGNGKLEVLRCKQILNDCLEPIRDGDMKIFSNDPVIIDSENPTPSIPAIKVALTNIYLAHQAQGEK